MEKILNYTVIFKTELEGGFTVVVPSLPGCVTYGKDLTHAKKMVVEAIQAYLGSLKKHNEPIPSDDSVFVSTVHLSSSSHSASYA